VLHGASGSSATRRMDIRRRAEAIEAAGATLIYLPKYSPDLNPIELAFSKLKAHLRKAAEHTILRLLRRVGRSLPISARKSAETSFVMPSSNMTGICSWVSANLVHRSVPSQPAIDRPA
jgi:hypothetical protein